MEMILALELNIVDILLMPLPVLGLLLLMLKGIVFGGMSLV
jgi:hypothetical protein